MSEINTSTIFFLFKLSEETFGLGINSIVEIIEEEKINPSNCLLPYFVGHHNYRDKNVPVIDLYKIIYPFEEKVSTRKKIIITEVDLRDSTFKIGLEISYGLEIIDLEPYKIQLMNSNKPGFIIGNVEIEGRFITLLNINKLIPIDELVLLKKTIVSGTVKTS